MIASVLSTLQCNVAMTELVSQCASEVCHVSLCFYLQMIETNLFRDVNQLTPIEGMTSADQVLSPMDDGQSRSRKWLAKIFKSKRQVSVSEIRPLPLFT